MAETFTGRVRSAGEAAEARAYGLTSGDLDDWASFAPIEIYWAVRHGITPAAARRWAREGLRISDTVRAIALGMDPKEVRPWARAGFAPSDAVEAKEMGIPLEAALAWRDAGFILPDAALLIHEGLTLKTAVNARYGGLEGAARRPASASGLYRPGRDDPAGWLVGEAGDSVEVAVVVQDLQAAGAGGRGDDEVGDRG